MYSLLLIPIQIKHGNHVNDEVFKNQKLTKKEPLCRSPLQTRIIEYCEGCNEEMKS